jgi:hypothetical protein
MIPITTLRFLNVAGFIFMIIMNALANALPLFGRGTGEISALYPNLFVPAGFTFSIWGLIYTLLLIFTIAQLRGAFDNMRSAPAYVAAIGPWFFISCLANGIWILLWHALQALLSLGLMLILLWSLIRVYQALNPDDGAPPAEGKYSARLPFSVYLGWISVASIANAAAVLTHYQWNGAGLSPETWTMIMIAAAIALALIFLMKKADVPYALVIVWALYGILARTQAANIRTLLIAGIALLLLAGAARSPRWLRQ